MGLKWKKIALLTLRRLKLREIFRIIFEHGFLIKKSNHVFSHAPKTSPSFPHIVCMEENCYQSQIIDFNAIIQSCRCLLVDIKAKLKNCFVEVIKPKIRFIIVSLLLLECERKLVRYRSVSWGLQDKVVSPPLTNNANTCRLELIKVTTKASQ